MSGAVLLVGWGVVEKDAMELEIESANCGSWAVSAGKIEVPLHDVKTLVLWEFTKHAPNYLCEQKITSAWGRPPAPFSPSTSTTDTARSHHRHRLPLIILRDGI
jgi:hypothetical protein